MNMISVKDDESINPEHPEFVNKNESEDENEDLQFTTYQDDEQPPLI